MQEAGAHAIEEAEESEDVMRPIKKMARAVMESESEEEEQEEEQSLACDECGEDIVSRVQAGSMLSDSDSSLSTSCSCSKC